MLIKEAIKLICSIPDSWVRVEQVRRVSGGLDLSLSIHKGRRGKKTDHWIVSCRGIREAQITDFDGGGLEVYSQSHPAARQYVARKAELRWPHGSDENQVLAALQRAHVEAVQD
jgi:hypothetical protein